LQPNAEPRRGFPIEAGVFRNAAIIIILVLVLVLEHFERTEDEDDDGPDSKNYLVPVPQTA
jgi:hypothetical protein